MKVLEEFVQDGGVESQAAAERSRSGGEISQDVGERLQTDVVPSQGAASESSVASVNFVSGNEKLVIGHGDLAELSSVDYLKVLKIIKDVFLKGLHKADMLAEKLGPWAVPAAIAYNGVKVAGVVGFGRPVMDFIGISDMAQLAIESTSVIGVLGGSTSMHYLCVMVGRKVHKALQSRGGVSVVFNDFMADEKS